MPIARQTFIAPGNRIVKAGQEVSSSDPVLRGREALFTEAVEEATAQPGERRSLPRKAPAKKAPAKKKAAAPKASPDA